MPHKRTRCEKCHQSKWNYKEDECGHVQCPLRKQITAAPPSDDTALSSPVFNGTMRRPLFDQEEK